MKLWIARAVSTQPFISWGVGGLMLYWFKCVFLLFLHTQPYCPNHLWLPSPDTNLLFQRSNDNNRLMEAYAQTHYCRLKTRHLMQPLKVLTWLSEVKQVQFFQFIALDELNEVDYNFKVCPTRLLNLFFSSSFWLSSYVAGNSWVHKLQSCQFCLKYLNHPQCLHSQW